MNEDGLSWLELSRVSQLAGRRWVDEFVGWEFN